MSKDPIAWLRELEQAARSVYADPSGPRPNMESPQETARRVLHAMAALTRYRDAADRLLPVLVEVVVQARQPWEVEKERLCSCCGNPVDDHLDNCALPKALAAIRAEQERQS